MTRFVITGAPGAGKTAIIRQLELDGFGVVEEAATDVIAAAHARGMRQPWTEPSFIDEVATLQRARQIRAAHSPDRVQFHDRSAVCTAALADYLGHPRSAVLAAELKRVTMNEIYDRRVFLVRTLGFITPSEARRISYEETLRFEQIHERVYREFGYDLLPVEPGSVLDRVARIKELCA